MINKKDSYLIKLIKINLKKANEEIAGLQRIEKIASEKGAGAAIVYASNTKGYLGTIEHCINNLERKYNNES